jgi:hypothetical protein
MYIPDIFEFGNPLWKRECDNENMISRFLLSPNSSVKVGMTGEIMLVVIVLTMGLVLGLFFIISRKLNDLSTEVNTDEKELKRLSSIWSYIIASYPSLFLSL